MLASTKPSSGLEDRHLFVRPGSVLEEISSVVRLIGTDHDQVVIAVSVCIKWHGPRPQTNAEINIQAGVVVLDPL